MAGANSNQLDLNEMVDFDPIWYRENYPDVALTGMDPLDHYTWIGKRLGRRANGGKDLAVPTSKGASISQKASAPPVASPVSGDGLPPMPQDPARWMRHGARISRQSPTKLKPLFRSFNPDAMNLHWIVSGELPLGPHQIGIFALIRQLEMLGHNQWVWLQLQSPGSAESAMRDTLVAQNLLGQRTILRDLPEDVIGISGDAVIATDALSCFPAAAMPLFKARFRMIQQLDADTQSDGTAKALASHAADLDFLLLCAGPELEKATSRPGTWVKHWPLFAEDSIFYPNPRRTRWDRREPLRLAVDLGRAGNPGVASDLVLDALELLSQRDVPFTAHLFGQGHKLFENLSFPNVHHDLLTARERGDLFRSCHVGISLTNGLDNSVKTEMLSCGLETIALGAPFEEEIRNGLHRVGARSAVIADKIEAVGDMSGTGNWTEFPAHTGRAAGIFVEALREGLSIENEPVTIARAMMGSSYEHKAAVIIPTWNGGQLFKDVLDALVTQDAPWSYETVVVDSGSTDETLEIVRSYEQRGVRLHTIPNSEFQHGRTRNLAISLTSSEFAAVLTQDATPANAHWLRNLVKAFDKGNQVAGVFGAHKAYPDATPFVSIGIEGHFEHFNGLPHVAQWNGDHGDPIPFGSVAWQNWIHYYSDNNSCMRRSVWEKIPYPNIDWGEDQVWAWEIVKQGYQKSYAHDAIVYHSHNLTKKQQEKVSSIEGEFWMKNFNYRFESSPEQVAASADYLKARILEFAASHSIDDGITSEQIILDHAGVAARYRGQANYLKSIYTN